MTEGEFNSCTDPKEMLEFLRDAGRLSERKRRLFATACCRHVWHLLTDDRSKRAVEVAESYADARASQEELVTAYLANETVRGELTPPSLTSFWREAKASASMAVAFAAGSEGASLGQEDGGMDAYLRVYEATSAAGSAARALALTGRARADLLAARANHAEVLRCIFGPLPFRTVAIEASWRTVNVLALARHVYEERDGSALAVLADALEEGGCADPDILGHLRGPGPHAGRGCWPVDLLLKKE